MDQTQAEALVISIIKEIQELSGRSTLDITLTTRPLIDLEEFDSLNAVEVTAIIEEKLDLKLASSNACIHEDGKTPLNVAGIASRLVAHLKAGQGA